MFTLHYAFIATGFEPNEYTSLADNINLALYQLTVILRVELEVDNVELVDLHNDEYLIWAEGEAKGVVKIQRHNAVVM